MIDLLSNLQSQGHLAALDVHFATAMGRLASESRPEVLLAAALVSRQVSAGHVCLALNGLSVGSLDIPVESLTLPTLRQWLKLLRASPLIDAAPDPGMASSKPLVLDEQGRLYLQRYWQHERALVHYIERASSTSREPVAQDVLNAGLKRLFPGSNNNNERDWQREAALMAVRQRFCVVSGGPGTGKTSTVVKILALLIEQAQARSAPLPQILLMAPTGKAATRLEASIRGAKARLDCSEAVQRAIVDKASTVHRCLGSVRGSTSVFRHDRNTPLVADVVLVDEASMVNLGLMRRLMDALPERTRLILLGDMDQLASVEAGAVLGDICNTGSAQGTTPTAPTAIAQCVIKLKKSYRYREDSGIAALAQAINAGDATRALQVLDQASDVQRREPGQPGVLGGALRRSIVQGYRAALAARTPVDSLRALDQFRVLCARRSGPYGVGSVNELLVAALAREGLLDLSRGGEHYAGRAVLITANDYDLRLFNGDIGMVLQHPEHQRLRTYFVEPDGSHRSFSPARLAAQETVFAMSVHKSQGSEFDEVAVVLPQQPSRVLTRELLYTAVTRAKNSVVIHGTVEVIRRCITERVERKSGLRMALWGAANGDSPLEGE